MLRNWWAKARLIRFTRLSYPNSFFASTLNYPEYADAEHDGRPRFQPYDGLAEIWDEYASAYQLNYSAFLMALSKTQHWQLKAVLDLACGTGTLTKSLARVTGEVVGLDASERMLSQARARSADYPSVQYVRGDFRSFTTDRQFSAVVCGFNSINYVGSVGELKAVFQRVAEYLLPGGWFVFDSITEAGMRLLSGLYFHVPTRGKRFAMRFEYDKAQRMETAVVLLPEGTEIHRRVPVDPRDVKDACQNSGLVVDDYFSSAFLPGWWYTGPTCFFVLRRSCAEQVNGPESQ